MVFDLTIIGCGVIGVETLHAIRKNFSKKKIKKKLKLQLLKKI